MTTQDSTTQDVSTQATAGPDWGLLTTFASGIGVTIVFLAWLLMGAGSGSAD